MRFDMKAFKEEHDAINEVYYRLYVDSHDEPCVVCMQWFDEFDYDKKRFINETKYETEEQAESALLAYKLKASVPLTNLEKFKVLALLESDAQ